MTSRLKKFFASPTVSTPEVNGGTESSRHKHKKGKNWLFVFMNSGSDDLNAHTPTYQRKWGRFSTPGNIRTRYNECNLAIIVRKARDEQ